jgi:hypothetical protein
LDSVEFLELLERPRGAASSIKNCNVFDARLNKKSTRSWKILLKRSKLKRACVYRSKTVPANETGRDISKREELLRLTASHSLRRSENER